jgi:biopolymer transport protein ExbB
MRCGKMARIAVSCAIVSTLLVVVVARSPANAQGPQNENPVSTGASRGSDHSGHFGGPAEAGSDFEPRIFSARLESIARRFQVWYGRTPPAERVTWGGMIACGVLGVLVILERLAILRRRAIMPRAFTARFLDRLHGGKLDCGQALDLCELNPSPAANVALAAVRRWGRPAADLERAVALAHRVETDRLRRNVGTLRRIAVLAPLLGLLGTLFAVERVLGSMPAQPVGWGPALAPALAPLSAGVVLATLALIAYDALLIRIEKLASGLDHLGAETIDAIAVAVPYAAPTMVLAHGEPRATHLRPDAGRTGPGPAARSPHQSYFRQDDGTGLIRHPGENSNDA